MSQTASRKVERLIFYTIKLPLIYLTIPLGFIFEYLVTFPYIVLSLLAGSSRKSKPKKN